MDGAIDTDELAFLAIKLLSGFVEVWFRWFTMAAPIRCWLSRKDLPRSEKHDKTFRSRNHYFIEVMTCAKFHILMKIEPALCWAKNRSSFRKKTIPLWLWSWCSGLFTLIISFGYERHKVIRCHLSSERFLFFQITPVDDIRNRRDAVSLAQFIVLSTINSCEGNSGVAWKFFSGLSELFSQGFVFVVI